MSNKLIAIWGSPASGKTITTLKLAQTLGAKNKNVLTIFSDPLCPSIPFLVPQIANKQQSLGELLSLPALAQDDLLRFSLSIKSSPRLGLLSYSKGDHAFSYANYDRERAVDFLTLARHIADVVLVDCTSYVSSSLLSTVALELADNVFRFHTCDLKSMMFYASNLPLLSDARFQQAPSVSVLSNLRPGQDSRAYSQVVGGIRIELPHLHTLEQQALEARLLEALPASKETAAYQQGIAQMMQLIVPEELSPIRPKASPALNGAAIVQGFKKLLLRRRGERK
ncbi:MAG: hypothetical protein E7L01_02265 [Paenibacillus macerans]|uniref:hypothetical protein n=1 Tax=Paenibacillus TaxID=44249 RepID=UPI00290A0610|nr:hypothetical protein [Paenibacillus macerans]MDU7472175.1 hypothetical protein [Paenibacillus macerans]MEC0331991.1 hypothetical protein [Paenibacillus macerans]